MNQNTGHEDRQNRNPVVRRLWDLASLRYKGDRVIIRHVVTRELVPDKRYEWQLFERQTDAAPVETVVLDVTLAQRLQIDDDVGVELDITRRSESRER